VTLRLTSGTNDDDNDERAAPVASGEQREGAAGTSAGAPATSAVQAGEAAPVEAWTIQRVLTWSTDFLKAKGEGDTPRLDAELMLSHAISLTRLGLYTNFDKPLTPAERERFKEALKRRAAGEPVAYILGVKEFMGHAFAVSRHVLIPRPDTEVLVETAQAAARGLEGGALLDIGTGSGCIAIALALRLPEVAVTAWDVDDDALALARANAARLGAERVVFAKSDALDAASYAGAEARYDLVVSNPPYIGREEEPSLARSVRAFEPHRALFADDRGLAFYRRFAVDVPRVLKPAGKLLVEIGAGMAAAVTQILTDAGWSKVKLVRDYEKRERVLVAEGAPRGSHA
jgi:release factor glutamine methyltransferase